MFVQHYSKIETGNSLKDYKRQPIVADEVGQQIKKGNHGIMGVHFQFENLE